MAGRLFSRELELELDMSTGEFNSADQALGSTLEVDEHNIRRKIRSAIEGRA